MKKMILKLAEKRIQTECLYDWTREYCREYLDTAEGSCDFSVRITPEDILFEREKSAREDEAEGNPIRQYSDEYLESLAVYRQIAEKMPEYDTVLFHGSAVAVDGQAYLFTAKSGTGKSTHARLWRELFGERAIMVNDDKPLIRVSADKVVVCGTPWDGKHRLSSDIAVPLKNLCVLERASENSIQTITGEEAYPMLLQQVYRPADLGALAKTLTLIDRLKTMVRFFRLRCNMEPEAARVAYEGMNPECSQTRLRNP